MTHKQQQQASETDTTLTMVNDTHQKTEPQPHIYYETLDSTPASNTTTLSLSAEAAPAVPPLHFEEQHLISSADRDKALVLLLLLLGS